MKSAWEIALERSGGALQELSEEKKKRIEELSRAAQAKIVAVKMTAEQEIAKIDDPEEITKIKERLLEDITAIQDDCQYKKDEIRNS